MRASLSCCKACCCGRSHIKVAPFSLVCFAGVCHGWPCLFHEHWRHPCMQLLHLVHPTIYSFYTEISLEKCLLQKAGVWNNTSQRVWWTLLGGCSLHASRDMKTVELDSLASVSSVDGSWYLALLMFSFSFWRPIKILTAPIGFMTRTIGAYHDHCTQMFYSSYKSHLLSLSLTGC